jgi:hypothetical protein
MTQSYKSLCRRTTQHTQPRYSRLVAAANSNAKRSLAVAIVPPHSPGPGSFNPSMADRSLLNAFGLSVVLWTVVIVDIALLVSIAFAACGLI